MKEFNAPEVEVIHFDATDVVVASDCTPDCFGADSLCFSGDYK